MCAFGSLDLGRVRSGLMLIAWLSLAAAAQAGDPSSTNGGVQIGVLSGWLGRSKATRNSHIVPPVTKASAAGGATAPAAGTAAQSTLPPTPVAAAGATKPATRTLRFQFRYEPWKDVLDWFAQNADLSLVMDAPPQGTFNYTDDREYTPAEALDILNSVLMTKGYMLIRHGRMLMLVNLEDGIPANLVPTVPVESLDTRGEFDLVSVLFDLNQLKPEEAEAEVKKLLGPEGTVVALGRSRQIFVTDTVGRLRAVHSLLQRIEGPALGNGAAQLQIYPTGRSDPQSVLTAMKMLMASQPDVQLSIDAKTNSLVALARPVQQAMIRAALAQMQQEGDRVEVIRLVRLDPQAALQSIKSLFPTGDTTKGAPLGPQVDVDVGSRQLMIRGTEGQIAEIRGLLEKMGEVMPAAGELAQGGRVRVLPLSGPAGMSAIKRLEEIWPSLRANKIVVEGALPPTVDEQPAGDQSSEAVPRQPATPAPASKPADQRQETIATPADKPSAQRSAPPGSKPRLDEHSASLRGGARIFYVAEDLADKTPPGSKPATSAPAASGPQPAAGPPATSTSPPPAGPSTAGQFSATGKLPPSTKPPAPIIVTPGPNGLIIASEDTEALDQFERLLSTLAGQAASNQAVTVFYLKFAKAAAVTEMLGQMLGGSTVTLGSTGGTPMGRLGGRFGAMAALLAAGSHNGATVTTMASPGTNRGVLVTGPIKITADSRLNALLVQANPADVETVRQLLKVLDQSDSPEDVTTTPKPRLIPVLHTTAQEVADIVKQVYADRMAQGPVQPTGGRQAFMAMMTKAGLGQQRDDAPKISVGVDVRTNSLIVAAPDSLFDAVRQLVEQLDTAAADDSQTVRVVALHKVSSEAVEEALAELVGDGVQVGHAATGQAAKSKSSGRQNPALLRGIRAAGQQRSGANYGRSGRGR